jgi:hypothetical protein
MSVFLSTPSVAELDEVVDALAEWRREGAPMQLHPVDVGFYWQFGPEVTAEALRTWRRDGRIVGVGMSMGPTWCGLPSNRKRKRTKRSLGRWPRT